MDMTLFMRDQSSKEEGTDIESKPLSKFEKTFTIIVCGLLILGLLIILLL